MSGYIRQSTASIQTGLTVEADPINAEYNTLASAFSATTGHRHDGTPSEGAPITVVGPTQNVYVSTTAAYPRLTNTVDLGTDVLRFKNIYLSGGITFNGALVGTGGALTGLNGSEITVGTVADARLPSTVVRTSRTLTAGAGISPIGNLSADRTIAIDSTVLTTTGNFVISGAKRFGNFSIIVDAASGTSKLMQLTTSNSPRWAFGADGVAESAGSGSNFVVFRYNDSGVYIDTAMSIDRSTGVMAANGGGLTNLNASNIASGTVADARLPSTVVKTSGVQSIADEKTFASIKLSGNLNADTRQITNLGTPSSSSQAATKGYVDGLVGTSQSWQNLTASRAHSTQYQNTTGTKIEVSVRATGSGIHAQVSSDASTWINVGTFIVSESVSANFSVPPNHYYRVNGAATINYWSELR